MRCGCGATVEVPPMRKLSHLRHVDADQPDGGAPNWTLRMGLVFLGLVLLVPSLTLSAYLYFNLPRVDPEVVRQKTERLSLLDTMHLWQVYANNSPRDLLQAPTPLTSSVLREREGLWRWIAVGLGVSVVGALVAASALLVRPARRARR